MLAKQIHGLNSAHFSGKV